MRPQLLALVACLSLKMACTEAPPPPPPVVAPGLVQLSFWDVGDTRPRVLIAHRVEQHGDRFRQSRFHRVRLRLPLKEGEVVLHTAIADVTEDDGGLIVLQPPVFVSGVLDGQPLMGRAMDARIRIEENRMELDEVEWVLSGQRIQLDRLVVYDQWRAREATQPRAEPASAPFAAALSALPNPLSFPRWRRDEVEQVLAPKPAKD